MPEPWLYPFHLAVLLLATAAKADPVQDCNSNDPDRRIAGCSALLKRGVPDKTNKALVHSRRGDAHLRKKNDDAALADFEACLSLDPKREFCRDGSARILCIKAITKGGSPSGIEQHCVHFKNSRDEAIQADYYQSLGTAYLSRYVAGSDAGGPAIFTKALENLGKAIAIKSAAGIVKGGDYDIRGLLYLQNKVEPGSVRSKYAEEAFQDFNKAVSLSPNVA